MQEQTARGGGGVTNPGDIQEMFICCIEEHGLVGSTGDSWVARLDHLQEVFSNLSDSMILYFSSCSFTIP